MKKLVTAAMLIAFAASSALAADEIVTMKAKNGDVKFNHTKHKASGDCKVCHGDKAPGKLDLDKDTAHKVCKGCHETKKAGPTKCGECHKK